MKGTLHVANPSLSITQRRDRETLTLLLAGEIDMASAPRLAEVLNQVTAVPAFRCLVLDLTAVEFMDSAGLHVLLDFTQRVHAAGCEFAVVSTPGSAPRRVMELTGLTERLGLTDTHPDQRHNGTPPSA